MTPGQGEVWLGGLRSRVATEGCRTTSESSTTVVCSGPSWAMTEGPRAVSTDRLVHRIGQADRDTVEQILAFIGEWFAS